MRCRNVTCVRDREELSPYCAPCGRVKVGLSAEAPIETPAASPFSADNSSLTLLPFQIKGVTEINAAWATRRRVLYYAHVGAGKTMIAVDIIRSMVANGRRVLVISDRRELINNAYHRLKRFGLVAGVVMGQDQRHIPTAPIQIASLRTAVRRTWPQPFDLIVIDEAHRAPGNTYRRFMASQPQARVLGLTATPWRLDGRGLGTDFDAVVVGPKPSELLREKVIVPCRGFTYSNPDLTGAVRDESGDFIQNEALADRFAVVMGEVVEQWVAAKVSAPTLVFCVTKRHSRAVAKAFAKRGVVADHMDGATTPPARSRKIAALANGKTQVLCNVGVLVDGFDLPSIGCIVLLRPTESIGRLLQMVGRGVRNAPNKEFVLLHDHSGSIARLGHPDDDRQIQLESDDGHAVAAPPRRTCSACKALYLASAEACPRCGASTEKSTLFVVNALEASKADLESTRLCSFKECGRKSHALGLCEAHYKQQWNNRQLTALKPRNEWGASTLCSFDGCGRAKNSLGMCVGHVAQLRRGDPLHELRKQTRTAGAQCLGPCCERPAKAMGLCDAHYGQRRRGVELFVLNPPSMRGVPCSAQGCQSKRAARGLCMLHYGIAKRAGNLPASAHIRHVISRQDESAIAKTKR